MTQLSNGQGKMRLLYAFVGVNTTATLGLATWLLSVAYTAGQKERQVAVNTERLTRIEQHVENIDANGTINSRVNLQNLRDEIKELRREWEASRKR